MRDGLGTIDDTALEQSFRLNVQIVPTLVRVESGREAARTIGWDRGEWERVSGVTGLGAGLPDSRPGCGSKTEEPGVAERLAIRFGAIRFRSREVRVDESADPIEACFEREQPIRVSDLPGGLDLDGRLVLVRRLVREGFLRVSG